VVSMADRRSRISGSAERSTGRICPRFLV